MAIQEQKQIVIFHLINLSHKNNDITCVKYIDLTNENHYHLQHMDKLITHV